MGIKYCKECPCFEIKYEYGLLGLGPSFPYGWCNKYKTRKDKNQETCSYAKDHGYNISCK